MTKIFLSIRYKYNGKSFIDLSQNQKNTKRKIISDFKEGILKWEYNKCRCSSNKDLTISMKLLPLRSEEHTSELQSRVDISYAVFCLKKKSNFNFFPASGKSP